MTLLTAVRAAVVVLALAVAAPAWAYTEFTWQTAGVATFTSVECGTTPGGPYSKYQGVKAETANGVPHAETLDFHFVIPVNAFGTYSCVAIAHNETGVSGPSNEITFTYRDVPPAPGSLQIR